MIKNHLLMSRLRFNFESVIQACQPGAGPIDNVDFVS